MVQDLAQIIGTVPAKPIEQRLDEFSRDKNRGKGLDIDHCARLAREFGKEDKAQELYDMAIEKDKERWFLDCARLAREFGREDESQEFFTLAIANAATPDCAMKAAIESGVEENVRGIFDELLENVRYNAYGQLIAITNEDNIVMPLARGAKYLGGNDKLLEDLLYSRIGAKYYWNAVEIAKMIGTPKSEKQARELFQKSLFRCGDDIQTNKEIASFAEEMGFDDFARIHHRKIGDRWFRIYRQEFEEFKADGCTDIVRGHATVKSELYSAITNHKKAGDIETVKKEVLTLLGSEETGDKEFKPILAELVGLIGMYDKAIQLYEEIGNYGCALEVAEEARESARKEGRDSDLATIDTKIGELVEKTITQATEEGKGGYEHLARTAERIGDRRKAMELIFQAIEFYENAGDYFSIIKIARNVGLFETSNRAQQIYYADKVILHPC